MSDNLKTKKQATRIFKKSTPNGKVTVYLGKRDFIDHLSHVDPIEGVVFVDPEYVKGRKVFISLVGAFKDCRPDYETLGITFCENLFSKVIQVFPPNNLALGVHKSNENGLTESPTPLQSRLIRKLGHNAHPFYFELPAYSPASVTMMLSNFDPVKPNKGRLQSLPCRVDYELKTFVADTEASPIQKRNSVKMTIRKLTYAPNTPGHQPSAETTKDFLMSPGNLKVEASLDKEKYFHGEDLVVNLLVDNNSNKTVRRVKITVRQFSQLQIQNNPTYSCTVAEINSEEDFPIQPSRTGWCKVYKIKPLLVNNRDKHGIAMDGDLKHEDTNLASSTIKNPNLDPSSHQKDMGIVVSYKVKIKLMVGLIAKSVNLELPFILTHPHTSSGSESSSDIDEVEMVTCQPDLTSSNNDLSIIQSNNPFLSDFMIEKTNSQRVFTPVTPKPVPAPDSNMDPFRSDVGDIFSQSPSNRHIDDLKFIVFPNQNQNPPEDMNPFKVPALLQTPNPKPDFSQSPLLPNQNEEESLFDNLSWNRLMSMNGT